MNGILYQMKNKNHNILMYHSSSLDKVEQGTAGCTRYLAALTQAITKTAHIVTCHPLTVHKYHGVVAHLDTKAFTVTTTRGMRLTEVLLQPHITCTNTGINAATGLPGMDENN